MGNKSRHGVVSGKTSGWLIGGDIFDMVAEAAGSRIAGGKYTYVYTLL